jgi:hypothetical protein
MSDARKVFPMNTFVSYMKGVEAEGQKKGIVELVGYMTNKVIDEEFAPFAAALAKAWIYEQHPELASLSASAVASKADNVSVPVLPDTALSQVNAIFDKLAEYKTTVNAQAEKLTKVEAELAEKTAILKDVETRMKAAEAKVKMLESSAKDEGEKVMVASQAKVEEYIGKVDELLKLIEDVKKHGVVTVASGGAGGGGAAPMADGPTDSGPTDDFGFSSDAFNKSDW